jgi:hypothetical protein
MNKRLLPSARLILGSPEHSKRRCDYEKNITGYYTDNLLLLKEAKIKPLLHDDVNFNKDTSVKLVVDATNRGVLFQMFFIFIFV